jgi:hypothetical protein
MVDRRSQRLCERLLRAGVAPRSSPALTLAIAR